MATINETVDGLLKEKNNIEGGDEEEELNLEEKLEKLNLDEKEEELNLEELNLEDKLEELEDVADISMGDSKIYIRPVIELDTKEVLANDVEALKEKFNEIKWSSELPWEYTQCLDCNKYSVVPDVEDDIGRELGFYEQTLDTTKRALKLFEKNKIEWVRPSDYYAEMVKTDDRMRRIKERLMNSDQNIKNADIRIHNAIYKKFDKKLKAMKLREKKKAKKSRIEKVTKLRKNREKHDRNMMDIDGRFDWDKVIDEIHESTQTKKTKTEYQPKVKSDKRIYKDMKFGFGGKKRDKKKNTSESSGNMSGFNKSQGFEDKKSKKIQKKRPGKRRRINMKSKQKSKG